MPRLSISISVALALLAAACQSSGARAERAERADAGADYVLVFLGSGPSVGGGADIQKVMAGHFANMQRLSEEGKLIVAGPLTPPRVDPRHRGIFVFDTGDVATAQSWAASDPGVQAGVFVVEAMPWRADPALRQVPAFDRELHEQVTGGGDPMAFVRPYVLVRCNDAQRAETALAGSAAKDRVLFFGRLTGEAPPGALFALDCQNVDEARELLRDAPGVEPDFWLLHPWLSTKKLVDLPRRGA